MALVILRIGWLDPSVTMLEMLPRRICRYRFFRIYEKDCYRSGLPVAVLEVIKGCRPRATGDHSGHVPPQSCLFEELGKGSAQTCLLLSCVTTTLNIYLHPHHLLPPISPFDQSSPSLYLFNQGLRSSRSNRRRWVAPSRFSQTITDSGTSVRASMRVSEWVVTTS